MPRVKGETGRYASSKNVSPVKARDPQNGAATEAGLFPGRESTIPSGCKGAFSNRRVVSQGKSGPVRPIRTNPARPSKGPKHERFENRRI